MTLQRSQLISTQYSEAIEHIDELVNNIKKYKIISVNRTFSFHAIEIGSHKKQSFISIDVEKDCEKFNENNYK